MNITLNGEPSQTDARTVGELVRALELDARKVAVELNLVLLPRSRHDDTAVRDGDRIEIVQFVGGG